MPHFFRLLFLVFLISPATLLAQSTNYFFPAHTGPVNAQIPTPEQFLGYPMGMHHTRHDQMVSYFRELDRLSDRVTMQTFGQTYEYRPLVMLTITNPANHARLETIKRLHRQQATQTVGEKVPLIVQLGYNVHGNEPSTMEAAILTAYYLTASESAETRQWLDDMVVFVDPCLNPDGRERHTNWANMHKGTPFVADPLDREHNEVWPGGRMNHYWFDLNRDWFVAIHPESQARLKFFHEWQPYVVTDHHEMGTNQTFYFDPGKSSSNNPIVPNALYNGLYPKFASHFAGAFDQLQSLYFTKERFDKLYPGYGSDYVNFFGGIGFLFEQASSRGHLQETTTVPLTFAFTIRNHVTAGLTTLKGAMIERNNLIAYRQEFYRIQTAEAKANPVKAYIFGDAADPTRTQAMATMMARHNIVYHELASDQTIGTRTFQKGAAFIVPTDQPSRLMVRSFFEKEITFTDSLFYDASAWSVAHAFNMPHSELKTMPNLGTVVSGPLNRTPAPVTQSQYAYVLPATDYNIHRAIHELQRGGAIVQTAFTPYKAIVGGKQTAFSYGTVMIPVQQQYLATDSLYRLVQRVSKQASIDVVGLQTGLSAGGVDVGSGANRTLTPTRAAMLVGQGVSAYEAGEIWHLLDQRVGMPITKIDLSAIGRANLSRYNTLVMVSGQYNFDPAITARIKQWVQQGGTLITLKTASEWAIRQGFTKEKLVKADTTKTTTRLDYAEAENVEGAKAIGGVILSADLDITHPLGFGFSERTISVYRNGKTFLQPSTTSYNTVVQYAATPKIGGYIAKSNLAKVAKTAAILVAPEGSGRVVLFADNPNFRAFWYGTNKLFLNALFMGSIITVPSVEGEKE